MVIGGFQQNEGRPTGIVRLWRRLRAADPQAEVLLRSWADNWNHLAELIWQCRNGDLPDVCLHGYSWGGASAVRLARELHRRGVPVRAMVLCDAVYRHRYRLGWWRSLVSWSKLEIPPNVREVFSLRQRNPRLQPGRPGGFIQPAGHDIIAESTTTHIHPAEVLTVDHSYMDDADRFHELALATALTRQPGPGGLKLFAQLREAA